MIRDSLGVRFENINVNDAQKLFDIRKSAAYRYGFLTIMISKFQFLYSDGKQSVLAMVLDSPKVERTLYDSLSKNSDDLVSFAFWRETENGEIFFHNVKDNTTDLKIDGSFYVLEFYKVKSERLSNLYFYWFGMPDFDKQLLTLIKDSLNAEIWLEDLALKMGVSPTKIGLTLQKFSILTAHVWHGKKHNRKISTSPTMLKMIIDRALTESTTSTT